MSAGFAAGLMHLSSTMLQPSGCTLDRACCTPDWDQLQAEAPQARFIYVCRQYWATHPAPCCLFLTACLSQMLTKHQPEVTLKLHVILLGWTPQTTRNLQEGCQSITVLCKNAPKL